MKTIFIFVFVICQLSLHSQDTPDFSKTKKIPLEADGYSVWAEVYTSEKEIKTDDDKFYCWVRANIVHTTQGSYDGRLLHGWYTEYYNDNQLKQQGEYKNGLRIGEWKSWYPNGVLKEITHWKNGKMNGRFRQYNESGHEIANGTYTDSEWDGKIHLKNSAGKDSIVQYKNGIATPVKTKKVRLLKLKKAKKEIIPLTEEQVVKDTLIETDKTEKPEKKNKDLKQKDNAAKNDTEQNKKTKEKSKRKENTEEQLKKE